MDSVVKIVLTHKDAKIPFYAKPGDAGADVSFVSNKKWNPSVLQDLISTYKFFDEKNNSIIPVANDCIIGPGLTAVLDLGLKIELQPGWEMQVRSRSGMAKRGLVVANAPGTIDSGYRGPCMVLLHNNTNKWRVIKPETRVAQFVLKRAPRAKFEQVSELSDSARGEDGLGSTGTK